MYFSLIMIHSVAMLHDFPPAVSRSAGADSLLLAMLGIALLLLSALARGLSGGVHLSHEEDADTAD
jgi:hypothetical protein